MLWCSDYEDKNSLSRFFAAIAIIFGYVETLIPVFAGIPGIKLGLANLSVLIILKKYGFKDAALVSVVRILVIGFLFGNMFSILYSLAGAALSLSVMVLLLKKTSLTTIGISVFWRSHPQYRSAYHCCPYCGKYCRVLLYTTSSHFRCCNRLSHRSPDSGSVKTPSFCLGQ